MVGGASTTRVAEAVNPLPPLAEATLEVVLVFEPAVVPVTFTEMVHAAPANNVAPDRLTLLDPAAAVTPVQLVFRPLGVDTTRPPGSPSVKPTPVSATVVFGFPTVKFRVVLWFNGIVAAPKFLVIVGGATTVMLAVAKFPLLSLSLALIVPVELFCTPGWAPITVAVRVQVAAWATLILFTPMLVGRPRVENEPHPTPPSDPTICRPTGRMSPKATPVKSSVGLGLTIVKVRLVVWPNGIVAAPNTLVNEGGDPAHRLGMMVLYSAVLPK